MTDDDKVAQNLLYSVQRLLAAIDGVQDWGGTEVGDAIKEVESQLFHWRTQNQRLEGSVMTTQPDDDLRLIVARTLGRLQGLQRYSPVPELYLAMSPDIDGDWLEAGDVVDAIKDLRRAIGDCTLDEEGK